MADAQQQQVQSIAADPNVVAQGATEPVTTPAEEQAPVSKDELKDLLTEIIKDIQEDKVGKEHIQQLREEINKAKQDLISVIVIAEETIKRIAGEN